MNDPVWIEFEAGNPDYPIWSGSFWEQQSVSDPGIRSLTTPAGHRIILDDPGKTLSLIHPDGAEITLRENEIILKKGSTSMIIDASGVVIR